MGVIVIGYIPKPEGRAALALGAQEASAAASRAMRLLPMAECCATSAAPFCSPIGGTTMPRVTEYPHGLGAAATGSSTARASPAGDPRRLALSPASALTTPRQALSRRGPVRRIRCARAPCQLLAGVGACHTASSRWKKSR